MNRFCVGQLPGGLVIAGAVMSFIGEWPRDLVYWFGLLIVLGLCLGARVESPLIGRLHWVALACLVVYMVPIEGNQVVKMVGALCALVGVLIPSGAPPGGSCQTSCCGGLGSSGDFCDGGFVAEKLWKKSLWSKSFSLKQLPGGLVIAGATMSFIGEYPRNLVYWVGLLVVLGLCLSARAKSPLMGRLHWVALACLVSYVVPIEANPGVKMVGVGCALVGVLMSSGAPPGESCQTSCCGGTGRQ